ncbi:outer membrane lipoprotein carrier protein LolA [Streptomyces sp. NPDC059096]|uniref:LolA family protein n=1 Tax=unclassified Streptomyces TaxID=2593676 RepID=UPI00367BC18E
MAPNDSAPATEDREPGAVRRKAARYALPVAVAGVAAATIGLVPALAATGDPELPKISAQQLIEKIAASDTEQLSGTVKISTDLGIPGLDKLGDLAGSFAPEAQGKGADGAQSADPGTRLTELAAGTHTLRVATDGPDKQRLSVLDDTSEYSLIHNGDEVWAYDSGSGTAYHATAPKGAKGGKDAGGSAAEDRGAVTPKDLAEQALKAAGDTTSVTVGGTSKVAGRDAYRLVIKPKQSGSTVGSITVAVDAKTGTPLKFTLAPSSGGKAVVDVGFTKVDFAKPAAGTFDFTPPKGTKVTEADDADLAAGAHGPDKAGKELPLGPGALGELGALGGAKGDTKVIGKGWSTVYVLTSPEGVNAAAKPENVPAEAQGFLDALGDKVTGKFGSGTVFQTRIVNALMTDDGTVYVGAVTKDALVKAADQAK